MKRKDLKLISTPPHSKAHKIDSTTLESATSEVASSSSESATSEVDSTSLESAPPESPILISIPQNTIPFDWAEEKLQIALEGLRGLLCQIIEESPQSEASLSQLDTERLIELAVDALIRSNDYQWTIKQLSALDEKYKESSFLDKKILGSFHNELFDKKKGNIFVEKALGNILFNMWYDLLQRVIEGIKAQGDLNSLDEKGGTLLCAATLKGNLAIMEALIGAGADVDLPDFNEDVPLRHAVREGNTTTIKALIKAKANLDARDEYGGTALHGAAQKNNPLITELLIKAKAELNARDIYDATALHWATEEGDYSAAAVLVAAGADVNALNDEKQTPLHYTAQNNSTSARALINAEADINLPDGSGKTPLLYAIDLEQIDTLKYLIFKGADVNAADSSDETPLDLIKARGMEEVLKYLQDQGHQLVFDSAESAESKESDMNLSGEIPVDQP